MSETINSDYIKKGFPTTEPMEIVKKETDAYKEDIEGYLKTFKDYFDTRATEMGLTAEQKEAREKEFLEELIDYAIVSAIALIKQQSKADESVSSAEEKKALDLSEEQSQIILARILEILGLESTVIHKDVVGVETQGIKTENEAILTVKRPLPEEIFDTFAKMRNDLVTGVGGGIGEKFNDEYRSIYKSLI
jgi:hypothetical protein